MKHYTYESDAGTFLLERQPFTESAWQFLFNGTFIDTYPCPFVAARSIPGLCERLDVPDPVLLPPANLTAWEIHWSRGYDGDSAELWLHQMYVAGRRSRLRA